VLNQLNELKPDVCVLAAYGFLIKPQLLGMPAKGFINIHPSLLPKYRGAAPIQRAIINGEKTTGVTTFYMNEAMDAGDLILQTPTEIGQDETFDELRLRLASVGADLIIDTLNIIREDKVRRIAQDASQKTIAKKIKKEDCIIDWNRPAIEIHNLIRGLSKEPGAHTTFRNKRTRIIKSTVPDPSFISSMTISNEPGKIVTSKKHLLVNTGNGILQILILQLEGGKVINSNDFINGQRLTQTDKFI
jgi:methionyl-tRNA formyltransferase